VSTIGQKMAHISAFTAVKTSTKLTSFDYSFD